MKPGIYRCSSKDCPYQTTIMVERSEKHDLLCPRCRIGNIRLIKPLKMG